jgi:hypothetical protein
MAITKSRKANINKYILLFSRHARTTTANSLITEYDWNLQEPLVINEQAQLELTSKISSTQCESGAEAVVAWVSATSISVSVVNPTTNGFYYSVPWVKLAGGTRTGAVATAVLTNGRVTAVTITGTLLAYAAATLPTITIELPKFFPYTIRCNNLFSKSIVHTDNGGKSASVKKGTFLYLGTTSFVEKEPNEPMKLVLEQQTINNISLSLNNSIFDDTGLPAFIEFVLCLKLTEAEPQYITFGGMENNTNQQIG